MRKVALTVDVEYGDRPSSFPLQSLQNLLAVQGRHDVPIAFFVQARWARANPELLKQLADHNGQIGLHGLSHVDYRRLSPEGVRQEILDGIAVLKNIIPDVNIKFFRLPYGMGADMQSVRDALEESGLTGVGWDFGSFDWDVTKTDAESFSCISPVLEKGGVVLFHSWPKRTAGLLEKLLCEKGASGSFVTLNEMESLGFLEAARDVKSIANPKQQNISRQTAVTSWKTRLGDEARIELHHFDGQRVVSLCVGDVTCDEPIITRLHSACLTSEVLGSTRCDCKEQLDFALDEIHHRGCGVLLYFLDHEGRGIGLEDKIRSYVLQDAGCDTEMANVVLGHPVDTRVYDCAPLILKHLGVGAIELLTNNPQKLDVIQKAGIPVARRQLWVQPASAKADDYMRHKRAAMDHLE